MSVNKKSNNIIKIKDLPDDVKRFLEMPNGIEKNIIFYDEISSKTFDVADVIKTDNGGFHYSEKMLAIKRSSDSYYVTYREKIGFTYENKKIKLFGQRLKRGIKLRPGLYVHIHKLLEMFGCDWFDMDYICILTKSGLEKMLDGKITNNFALAKHYLKTIRFKNVSPKLYLLVIKTSSLTINLGSNRLKEYLYSLMLIAKNPNHLLERLLYKEHKKGNLHDYYHLNDLVLQAKILNRKINFLWSKRRMEEEHQKWTKEIMKIKIKTLSNEKINLPKEISKLKIPKEFTLIKTTLDLFNEGNQMKHCIFTNYKRDVQKGKYVVFNVKQNGHAATMTLSYLNSESETHNSDIKTQSKFKYHACFGKKNSTPSKEINDLICDFINKNKPLISFLEQIVNVETISNTGELYVNDDPDFNVHVNNDLDINVF